MLGLDRRTLHDILPPIHVGIHDRVVTESETFQCIFVESVLRLFVVIIHLIKELGVGVTVRHFQNPCGLLDADRGRNGYLGFSFLSSAGGNQDYTIGTRTPNTAVAEASFRTVTLSISLGSIWKKERSTPSTNMSGAEALSVNEPTPRM